MMRKVSTTSHANHIRDGLIPLYHTAGYEVFSAALSFGNIQLAIITDHEEGLERIRARAHNPELVETLIGLGAS